MRSLRLLARTVCSHSAFTKVVDPNSLFTECVHLACWPEKFVHIVHSLRLLAEQFVHLLRSFRLLAEQFVHLMRSLRLLAQIVSSPSAST